jgi:hypothetical protein
MSAAAAPFEVQIQQLRTLPLGIAEELFELMLAASSHVATDELKEHDPKLRVASEQLIALNTSVEKLLSLCQERRIRLTVPTVTHMKELALQRARQINTGKEEVSTQKYTSVAMAFAEVPARCG